MIRAALDCQEADPEDGPECEVYYAYLAMLAAAPVPTIPATPAGYVLRNETGMTVAFNASEPAEGELPEGWTEVPVFTAQSSGLPLNVAPADERPEISASLVKTVAEGALGLNPTLSKEDAEELLGYLSKLTGSR
jgi:hypothetical protein